jgi:hypothetical protein
MIEEAISGRGGVRLIGEGRPITDSVDCREGEAE